MRFNSRAPHKPVGERRASARPREASHVTRRTGPTPPESAPGQHGASRAERVTHILFVCDDTADAQPCLCALAEAHFDVEADVVTGIADYLGRLHAVAYDVVVSCRSIDDDVPRRAWSCSRRRRRTSRSSCLPLRRGPE